MKIPGVEHLWRDGISQTDKGTRNITFMDIYEAINNRTDFNEPQLFYLSRLVARKLKAFHLRMEPEDMDMRPYQQTW